MPGELNPNARCPKCNEPLIALSDLTSSLGVVREFFHSSRRNRHGKRWRKGPCTVTFTSTQRDLASLQRQMLEVATSKEPIQ